MVNGKWQRSSTKSENYFAHLCANFAPFAVKSFAQSDPIFRDDSSQRHKLFGERCTPPSQRSIPLSSTRSASPHSTDLPVSVISNLALWTISGPSSPPPSLPFSILSRGCLPPLIRRSASQN